MIAAKLKEHQIRVYLDDRSETMQNKIRQATLQKIPYMLVMGGKEASSPDQLVSVRQRNGVDLKAIPIMELIKMLTDQVKSKDLNLIK
jgi:threonyl-tRNA synthetase